MGFRNGSGPKSDEKRQFDASCVIFVCSICAASWIADFFVSNKIAKTGVFKTFLKAE